MKKAFGIYINCVSFPFIAWILSGAKLYETRTRNTLRTLIGQRVFLIATGKGAPMITGSAIITGAELVPYSDRRKRARAKITGTTYDVKPGGAKWFYKLEDVQPMTAPIPVPAQRENHGRAWTSWEV